MTYDLIIIGMGAAGYTAAIYASRYNMNVLIIGSEPGGLGATAHKIENWPGEPSISGADLMTKFAEHIKKFNIPTKQELVKKIQSSDGLFNIYTDNKQYQSKTVILAVGTKHRQLNISGEEKFRGKGVSYCATCDGAFFKNKNVAIIGGGDSAFTAGMQLSDIAQQVYLIYIEEQPKAMPKWVDKVKKKQNIALIPKNTIVKITGEKNVDYVGLQNEFNSQKQLRVDGVFIEIGVVPNNQLIDNLGLKKSEHNYIEITAKQETNIPGCFAAGDVTTGSSGFAQLITASAEGAIAALSAYKYLKK